LLSEIKAIKEACHGKLLKVIIECCFLTDEEKIKLCEIVTASGADYIKTSTGFGGGGATREDVALFKAHVAPHVKIKAAGGIADLNDAKDFIALGADRLGTSRIVKAASIPQRKIPPTNGRPISELNTFCIISMKTFSDLLFASAGTR
jgi:deoxyribose-phosphate aldolase